MYKLLGLSLALAALLCANVAATLLSIALWRALGRVLARRSASAQAQILLYLRLMPFACAALFVCGFIVPAYLYHEPHTTNEVVSFKLALFAACCFAGLALALWRGLRSWIATRRLVADWLRHSEPVTLAGVSLPVYRVRHRFPVIAVVGVRRPRLFIASHLFDELSTEELHAAVMHEQGHLAARDNLKRALLRACRDVLMLIPAGRTLDDAWAEQSEAAADEHAAQTGGATLALDLASALVKIARLVPAGGATPRRMPAGAFLVGASGARGIAWRVGRLARLATNDLPHSHASNAALNLLLAVALGFALIASATVSLSQPQALAPLHDALEHVVDALK
ncbi:MAG TPA: M56 family metallopeptidase [Pyrinomonadaceae bacterium]|nr:M56 family metallopeptidase [Pyrinomonadaceae bacterium]